MLLALRESHPWARPAGQFGASSATTEVWPDAVSTITVSRRSPHDVGIREVYVLVDGQQVAMLRSGEAVSHELPAGRHRVRAHNTLFWKTHDIVLKPGEHVRFTAVNRVGWASFGFLIVLGAAPVYLTFEREG